MSARPVSTAAPAQSEPADQVTLTGGARNSRAALWGALGVAEEAALNQVPGPVSAAVRQGLAEVMGDIERSGGQFVARRSWLTSKLTGAEYARVSRTEALESLLDGKGTFLLPPGDPAPAPVHTLATLAAYETLYQGAEPTNPLANGLRNLYDRGYRACRRGAEQTRLQAFEALSRGEYVSLEGPTRLSSWYSRPEEIGITDFFEVSGDPRSLRNGEFGQALIELQKDGWIADARRTYQNVQKNGQLLYRGIPVATLEGSDREAVEAAKKRAERGCRLADEHVLGLVESGRLEAQDAGPVVEAALAGEPGSVMRLTRAAIGRIHDCPGAWAARAYGQLERPESLDTLIELVGSVGSEAADSLKFLDDPARTQGLWALPLPERSKHLQTLSRLMRPGDARKVLEQLDAPVPAEEVPLRIELMARLAAGAKMHSSFLSGWSLGNDYGRLKDGDPAETLACLKIAHDNALMLGGLPHLVTLTEAERKGWDSKVLCHAATRMESMPEVKPERELAALIEHKPGADTAERYLELLETLSPTRQTAQAGKVFPKLEGPQDLADFTTLLSHLHRVGHAERAADIFLALKQRPSFPDAMREALTALAIGTTPDEILRSAGSASALEQKGNQLRVGSVVLKTRALEG